MKNSFVKRFCSVMLIIAFTFAIIPMSSNDVHAAVSYGNGIYDGEACTSDVYAGASIDSILKQYPEGTTFDKGGQCFGYAEFVRKFMGGVDKNPTTFSNLAFNKQNVLAKCSNAKAGLHLRISRKPEYNAYSGHSIVLFKVSDNLVCWSDNNYTWDNKVEHYKGTMDEFIKFYDYGTNGYKYINGIFTVDNYATPVQPTYVLPTLSLKTNADYSFTLSWTKATGTSEYHIYRADSVDGTYKEIAKTNGSLSYIDKTVSPGKAAYYKIGVTQAGNAGYSNIVNGIRKLCNPTITLSNVSTTGKIKIDWNKIPGATSYNIYRYNGKSYVKIASTKNNNYIDNSITKFGVYYVISKKYYYGYGYKVSANCDVNTAANSVASTAKWLDIKPAKATVKFTRDSKGRIKITWKKTSGAQDYYVYRSTSANSGYKKIATTKSVYFVDKNAAKKKKYYYKIKAHRQYTYVSAYSNIVSGKRK